MAQFPVILAGTKVTASLLTSMLPLGVVKPSLESVTSSTVLQNDDALFLPLAANAAYDFHCYILYTAVGGAAGDIKWAFTVPAGTTGNYCAVHNEGGATGLNNSVINYTITTQGFAAGPGAGSFVSIDIDGSVQTSSTTGNLQLTWAQNTSNATATSVAANSKLTLTRTA